MSGLPLYPSRPERICWGCNKYCPAGDLACGNGTIRTPHPCETFGEDWLEVVRENGYEIGGPDPSSDEQEEAQRGTR